MCFYPANFRPLVAMAALATLVAFSLPGCGSGAGGGDNLETVYMHVFNGYPGSQSLSLYGPSGRVVTNLPFGERTPEPVAINRNYGSDFVLVLDGAPQSFPLQENLFALYPQETATFFVGQRRDATASIRVFRHIRSISPACRLVMNNSLALQSDGLGEFAFIPGIDFTGKIDAAGYDEERERAELDPEDQRPWLFNEIAQFPFFALVEIEEASSADADAGRGRTTRVPAWIGFPDRTDANIDYTDGTLFSYRPSEEYIACIKENEEAEDEDEEASTVDCAALTPFTADTYNPDDDDVTEYLQYFPEVYGNPPGVCDISFKIFSDFDNIFTGSHGHDGYNQNQRISFDAQFGISDHFIFVLYGRPVEPRIESWISSDPTTGGGFVQMDSYP